MSELPDDDIARHAQQWPDAALAIAPGIAADRSGDQVAATGGRLRSISPWRIDEGSLEPVQFRWSPREPREDVGSQS